MGGRGKPITEAAWTAEALRMDPTRGSVAQSAIQMLAMNKDSTRKPPSLRSVSCHQRCGWNTLARLRCWEEPAATSGAANDQFAAEQLGAEPGGGKDLLVWGTTSQAAI